MFALDHIQYARWMSVFLADLQQIHLKYPSVFEAFKKGYFTVKNSSRIFSNIGADQAHEQNNKLVKIDRGAIGILDNPNALLRWAVAGPVISQICKDAELVSKTSTTHHEDKDCFERKFRTDFDSLFSAFLKFGNPFKEEEDLVQLSSKVAMEKASSQSVKEARQKGREQHQTFIKERLSS